MGFLKQMLEKKAEAPIAPLAPIARIPETPPQVVEVPKVEVTPIPPPAKPLSALQRMKMEREAKSQAVPKAAPVVTVRADGAEGVAPKSVPTNVPIVSVPTLTIVGTPPAKIAIVDEPPSPAQDLDAKALAALKNDIAFLYANLENRELIAQVVRKIMEQVRKNPHFRSQVSSTDKEKIVAGFRFAYKAAARKKVEGKEKKVKARAGIEEISGMMKDMGFGDIEF